MKKWVKILLVTLLVIIVAVSALVIWQWKNIQSIRLGLSETAEQIVKRRNENQEKLVENINDYLDDDVRDFTPEEKALIEKGELKAEDIYLQIFTERAEGNTDTKDSVLSQKNDSADASVKSEQPKTSQKKEYASGSKKTSSGQLESSGKATKDDVVVEYVAQLYSLQSQYTAKAEVTISEGKSYYKQMLETKDKTTARADTIKHFTPIVRSVESECDQKVDSLVSELEKELEAIGENTDIARTIKKAYEEEKQLKLSYYANRYLK